MLLLEEGVCQLFIVIRSVYHREKGTKMIILDGGLGRQLKAMGAPFQQPEWSALALMEGPDFIRVAHNDFIAAGADIITTNSYAVVPFHIGETTFWDRGGELLDLAGQLAQSAADASERKIRVAGGVPPMFGSYQPTKFDVNVASDMLKMFRQHLNPYVDFFMAETQSSITEAQCFLDVFAGCGKPLWLSLTLEDANPIAGKPMLRSGEFLTDLLLSLDDNVPSAVLFNCSQPEVMDDAVQIVVRHFAGQVNPPQVGVLANAFPLMKENYKGANDSLHDLRDDITPQAYADFAVRWAESGAGIIGGCCGISPDHLKVLKTRFPN
jgi:S-methylmethionine-dependent homocysteine/selenocysteine methylase